MVAVCNDDTVLVMVCPVAYIWCTFVDGQDYVFSNYTSSLSKKKYPFLIEEAATLGYTNNRLYGLHGGSECLELG